MPDNAQPAPPDQRQRDIILNDLGTNILVEAAAGTGKTTSMVGRMVALLRQGECEVGTLAAVTFTKKAASELRGRFQAALAKEAARARCVEKQRLSEAARCSEQAFIGTIHSFCGRLLRERPIEAGVDIAFEEIDDQQDMHLRDEAWRVCLAELFANEDPILDDLHELGLNTGDLAPVFRKFAGYPDVDEWPGGRGMLPDLTEPAQKLRAYVAHLASLVSVFPERGDTERKRDDMMNACETLVREVRYTDLSRPKELMRLLELINPKIEFKKTYWFGGKKEEKARADAEKERWDAFAAEVAGPMLNAWRARRYAVILDLLQRSVVYYDAARAGGGVLNFQDLLIKTAALLRDKPHVRAYFAKRITHLLVDEFQDTDPVQAEVMMFLAADDPHQTDWRECRPRPGSLFVVGDPKQSIYRFRRADIVTYNIVRGIIHRTGGRIATLSANFRTRRELLDWVNNAFAPQFPEAATDASPVYVALEPGRGHDADGLAPVQMLTIGKEHDKKEPAVDYESDVIARTIHHAIEHGGRSPGDFLIIAYKKDMMSVYAAKLEALGVPHRVTGGTSLNDCEELGLLYLCLRAVVRPDDPVALVAALRSPLFGVSDAELYAFKKAGHEFCLNRVKPDVLDSPALSGAFAQLRACRHSLRALPPVAAAYRIAAELGLFARAALAEGGDVRAGSLGKALELLRAEQHNFWSAEDLVDYLARLVEGGYDDTYDGLSAADTEGPAVRIMNLHKSKGLEAPVVFLATPSGLSNQRKADLHIDRGSGAIRGYMAVYGPGYQGNNGPLLAHPEGWPDYELLEAEFAESEALRLLYVATTRAGLQLNITQAEAGRVQQYNCWKPLLDHLDGVPGLVMPGGSDSSATASAPPVVPDAAGAADSIEARWQAVRAPSYSVERPSIHEGAHIATTAPQRPPAQDTDATLDAAAWGSVLHRIFECAMTAQDADLRCLAENALWEQMGEEPLPPEAADDAVALVRRVMGTETWRRAQASGQCLVETPFTCLDNATGGLVRGSIDLAFRERGGWVIVDYKSDDRPGRDLGALVEKHAPQVQAYCRAWEAITGAPAREAGLLFVNTGEFRVCHSA